MVSVAGPRPVPLITKTAPCAMGELKVLLLAALAMLVMTGPAESPGSEMETRQKREDKRNRVGISCAFYHVGRGQNPELCDYVAAALIPAGARSTPQTPSKF